MALKLNQEAYDHATQLIQEGRVVRDGRDGWSEHQPSAQTEDEFIQAHSFEEYGKWHLAVDEKKPANTKARYKHPIGNFQDVHLCALITAEGRAGQNKHYDIETAASRLHGMVEVAKHA
jgi:hypothetical protein